MPRPRSVSPPAPRSAPLAPLSTRMQYVIGRGEQGVLTFEPYKSFLLPLWRFRTPDVARESCARLEREFDRFVQEGDFVGADMARKFLQGMTRSQRYANRAGGRKYDASGALLPKSTDHAGAADKLESAGVFREAWERAKQREAFQALRATWEEEKRAWEKENPEEVARLKQEVEASKARKRRAPAGVKKVEDDEGAAVGSKARAAPAKKRRRVKRESSEDEDTIKGEESE